jgi:hypothetical protein
MTKPVMALQESVFRRVRSQPLLSDKKWPPGWGPFLLVEDDYLDSQTLMVFIPLSASLRLLKATGPT